MNCGFVRIVVVHVAPNVHVIANVCFEPNLHVRAFTWGMPADSIAKIFLDMLHDN